MSIEWNINHKRHPKATYNLFTFERLCTVSVRRYQKVFSLLPCIYFWLICLRCRFTQQTNERSPELIRKAKNPILTNWYRLWSEKLTFNSKCFNYNCSAPFKEKTLSCLCVHKQLCFVYLYSIVTWIDVVFVVFLSFFHPVHISFFFFPPMWRWMLSRFVIHFVLLELVEWRET